MSAAITLEDVTFCYGKTTIIEGLSLKAQAGDVLSLLGPSGSGKSTLLRIIMGFLAPSRGVVRVRGQVASEAGRVIMPPEERNLAVVFQNLALWPHLTVEGNLAFGLRSKRVPDAEAAKRIAQVLEDVGLAGTHMCYPAQLSGGEQQRVAIARALVLQPDAVLLDEPLSNLDIGLREDLLHLFSKLFREYQTTALCVTHDPWEARELGGRVIMLDEGHVVSTGSLDELDPAHENPFVRLVCRHLAR
ncbi:MAG: ABC transporter ATP-binding protein [Deltaproteobacteria bacterium]|nr:ABC transporter ATP-binding protein [Deltaproteobacteria bacterium]